jgi:hypothetical protein
MRYEHIRNCLKPYSIVNRRTTTINHAFAASIAPFDIYDEGKVIEALKILGQDTGTDLLCAYCGTEADTWGSCKCYRKGQRI